MTPRDKNDIRLHLVGRLESLERHMELAVSGVQACPDENEYASRVAEHAVEIALRKRTSDTAREIRIALGRLDSPAFGECEECGEDIGLARIKANPTARFCVHCQEEMEREAAVAC